MAIWRQSLMRRPYGKAGRAVGAVAGALHGGGRSGGRGVVTFFDPDVASRWAVRRLTPLECERLQEFPDGWTAAPWRGRAETPDGVRYRALGNAMAVNCIEWLGRRIDLVRELG